MTSRIFIAALCLFGCSLSQAATVPATVDAATRTQLIDRALKMISQHYVFPPVAAKIDVAIRAHQKRGDYDRVTSAEAFAELFSAHLLEVAHDGHLSMHHSDTVLPPDPGPNAAPDPNEAAAARFSNNGFDRVERRN